MTAFIASGLSQNGDRRHEHELSNHPPLAALNRAVAHTAERENWLIVTHEPLSTGKGAKIEHVLVAHGLEVTFGNGAATTA
jgi:hypothetical protein